MLLYYTTKHTANMNLFVTTRQTAVIHLHTIAMVTLFSLLLPCTPILAQRNKAKAPAGYQLIYSDEFNGTGKADSTKWTYEVLPKGWANHEEQTYTNATHDNAVLRNGCLVITGKKDYPTGDSSAPWSSARLISKNKMDFLYGKVEVRAKLPRARGSWPAIWMMPTESKYGRWPRSGELDIMEHIGHKRDSVFSSVHTESKNWMNKGLLSGTRILQNTTTDFHVYGLEWTADSVRFTYDGQPSFTFVNPKTNPKDWPFDQKFYIILNVAIGGGLGGAITDSDWPDSMEVDYVRVYQKER
ncbi:glycoside hydrolase family 16 protein [Filimonas zeae]|uniref:glycoside hydrolase family 16 protein n=1 Tax=Filimonas zeae TaxID=1737353 RepID=UPI0021CE45DD|nr:glycoside hydrolase family 16 protein [Filimonas zeae]